MILKVHGLEPFKRKGKKLLEGLAPLISKQV